MVYDPERGCTRTPGFRRWEPVDIPLQEGIVSVNRATPDVDPVLAMVQRLAATVAQCRSVATTVLACVTGDVAADGAAEKEPLSLRSAISRIQVDADVTLSMLNGLSHEMVDPRPAHEPMLTTGGQYTNASLRHQ